MLEPASSKRPHATAPARVLGGAAPAPRTPAQWYLLVSGVVVVVIGAAGLFVDNSFELALHVAHGPAEHQRLVFGVFATNGWHNAAALTSGVVALVLCGTRHARRAARHLGIAYLALTLAVVVEVPLPLVTDACGNLVHLALATGGIGSAAFTRARPTASP